MAHSLSDMEMEYEVRVLLFSQKKKKKLGISHTLMFLAFVFEENKD